MGIGAKLTKLAEDPVLRRWLWLRLLRRGPRAVPFTPHCPPYFRPPVSESASPSALAKLEATAPHGTLTLPVPGGEVTVEAGCLDLFERAYDDGETLSALHRFAWLPLMPEVDHGWVEMLWQAWCAGSGQPDDGPAWEAYTAAERVANILDFARRRGLPGDTASTLRILAAHGPAMVARLEYYGEHGTCNHLANNGRGLYRLGLELGMADTARAGLDILIKEAERLFPPSGVLREASTHYHLLYLRNYADCWLAARRHNRPEAGYLAALVQRLWAVVPHLVLPGGLPLIGDISPDSPPDFLSGLMPGGDMTQGWTGLLTPDERETLARLRDGTVPVDTAVLAADGWWRGDFGRWSALWHVEPAGWRLPTGHGHEDLGAPEIHFDGVPLFVDPGRGAYGESGEAALYASAAVHGTLQVDSHAPYPANKPYYDPAFRAAFGLGSPSAHADPSGFTLRHAGFSRLPGVAEIQREWRFDGDALTINDRVDGRGRHDVTRRLVLTMEPRRLSATSLEARLGRWRVVIGCDTALTARPMRRWSAYGQSVAGWAVEAEHAVTLPFTGTLTIVATAA